MKALPFSLITLVILIIFELILWEIIDNSLLREFIIAVFRVIGLSILGYFLIKNTKISCHTERIDKFKRLINSTKLFQKDLKKIDDTIFDLEISDAQYMYLRLEIIKTIIDVIEELHRMTMTKKQLK
jgi:hypothetical protein